MHDWGRLSARGSIPRPGCPSELERWAEVDAPYERAVGVGRLWMRRKWRCRMDVVGLFRNT